LDFDYTYLSTEAFQLTKGEITESHLPVLLTGGGPMTIVRTEMLNVEANRAGMVGKNMNIRIDVNSNISQIFLTDPETARVDFRFVATYTGLGTISIEGRITYKDGAKELFDKWTESGQMPEKPAQEIHSTIMKSCMPVAVLLSREVNLPPPIQLPVVNVKGKKQKKTQSSGMEVA
jgi:hypothetical protein